MTKEITIPLTEGEWNIVLHALNFKAMDWHNSKLAKEQYEGLYNKLTDLRNEK